MKGFVATLRHSVFLNMCRIGVSTGLIHDLSPIIKRPGEVDQTIIEAGGIKLHFTCPISMLPIVSTLAERHEKTIQSILERLSRSHKNRQELTAAQSELYNTAYYNDLTKLPKETKLKEDIKKSGQERLNIAFIRIRGFKNQWNEDESAAK